MLDTFSALILCFGASTVLIASTIFANLSFAKSQPLDNEIHWTR
jgi:hypothetical protein